MSSDVKFGSTADHVAFQIHLTWRALRKKTLTEAKAGGRQVNRGSYSIPILIGLNPGISPQELAGALHLDATKVALILRGMEADGLCYRAASKIDRRKVTLHLTPEGEEYARDALEQGRRAEARWIAMLDEGERKELMRILKKLRDE